MQNDQLTAVVSSVVAGSGSVRVTIAVPIPSSAMRPVIVVAAGRRPPSVVVVVVAARRRPGSSPVIVITAAFSVVAAAVAAVERVATFVTSRVRHRVQDSLVRSPSKASRRIPSVRAVRCGAVRRTSVGATKGLRAKRGEQAAEVVFTLWGFSSCRKGKARKTSLPRGNFFRFAKKRGQQGSVLEGRGREKD